MEKKTKNIVLLSLLAGTVAFVLVRRKINSNQAKALLDFVNAMPSQVDLSSNVDKGISDTMNIKPDWTKLKIDNLLGPANNSAIRDAMAKIVTNLNVAMAGLGTDDKKFYKEIFRIKNKTTLSAVNTLYKAQHGETLFDAMKGETALNNVYFAQFSDKTKNSLFIPGYSDAKWSPLLNVFFTKLPIN